MPLTSQPLAPQHASTPCLMSVLLSTQIAMKRHGANFGDVRLGCWRIAGSSGHGRLSVIARSASRGARALAVQCCPQKKWVEGTAQGNETRRVRKCWARNGDMTADVACGAAWLLQVQVE